MKNRDSTLIVVIIAAAIIFVMFIVMQQQPGPAPIRPDPAPHVPDNPTRLELRTKIARLVHKSFNGSLKAAFTHYDTGRPGKLGRTELANILADAGVGNWISRGSWVSGIIAAMDTDADGMISWPELQAALKGAAE